MNLIAFLVIAPATVKLMLLIWRLAVGCREQKCFRMEFFKAFENIQYRVEDWDNTFPGFRLCRLYDKQISALNERIRTLNESLDGLDCYKKLTDEQKKQIAELTKCLKEANEKTAELMGTIERQQKELETLKNELIEIKKPFSSPVGQFFAKIINAILSVLNYIFNKK